MTTVHYQFTEPEAIRGVLKIRRRNHPWEGIRGPVAAAITTLLIVFQRVHRAKEHLSQVIFIGCLGAIFAMAVSYLAARFFIRRAITGQVRGHPEQFTSPCELSFDDRGVNFSSASLKHEFAWTVFKERREDKQYFYLSAGAGGFFGIIPKRAFDDTSLAEFRRCSQISQPA